MFALFFQGGVNFSSGCPRRCVVQKGAVGGNSGTGLITGRNYVDEVRADSCCVGAELLSQGETPFRLYRGQNPTRVSQ